MAPATTSQQTWPDSILGRVWDYEHAGSGQVVLNVEALCRKHLNRVVARLSHRIEQADWNEALTFLLGEVVVVAVTRWPQRRDRYPQLGAYLDLALPTALIDHWRSYHGRNGQKRVVSLPENADKLASDSDPFSSELADDSLEARTEEFVLGYLDVRAAIGRNVSPLALEQLEHVRA